MQFYAGSTCKYLHKDLKISMNSIGTIHVEQERPKGALKESRLFVEVRRSCEGQSEKTLGLRDRGQY